MPFTASSVEGRGYCLAPDACVAKTPGKHCVRCCLVLRNKSPEHRAAVGAYQRQNCALAAPEAQALARTPEALLKSRERRAQTWMSRPAEVRRAHSAHANRAAITPKALAKRAETLRRRALAWCPPAYRGLNADLKSKRVLLADRKRIIADQIAADARAARWQIAEFDLRQRERVAREKRDAY